jgi:hypothetical protein
VLVKEPVTSLPLPFARTLGARHTARCSHTTCCSQTWGPAHTTTHTSEDCANTAAAAAPAATPLLSYMGLLVLSSNSTKQP